MGTGDAAARQTLASSRASCKARHPGRGTHGATGYAASASVTRFRPACFDR